MVCAVLKIAVENIALILVHIYNERFAVTGQDQFLGGDVCFLNQSTANPNSNIVLTEGWLRKRRFFG